jgi:hypothetical protein
MSINASLEHANMTYTEIRLDMISKMEQVPNLKKLSENETFTYLMSYESALIKEIASCVSALLKLMKSNSM